MAEPRFVADAMLGRLARWLRAMGYDVVYDPALHDPELVDLAAREGRTLLTRDRGILRDFGPDAARLVDSQAPGAQVREVVERFGLEGWRERLFTRCMVCNAPLEAASADVVEGAVPADVRAEAGGAYRHCPSCGRVYWEGSHTERMRRWLEATVEGDAG